MLHGRAIIDLHNNKTHRDERIVHDNMLTNWLSDVLPGAANLSAGFIAASDITSAKLFGGLIMFRNALSNDASDYLFPLPSENRMIAHANLQTYSGNDLTRGSYNDAQSSATDGTITNVWDFTQEQGNGTIASLGLCLDVFGKIGSGGTANVVNNATERTYLPSTSVLWASDTTRQNVYNRTTGILHAMTLANGILTIVDKSPLTKTINPVRVNFAKRDTSPSSEYSVVNSPTLATRIVDLSSVLGSVSKSASWLTDDGQYLYMLPAGSDWSNGASKTLVKVKLEDGTYTTQTVTNNTGRTLYLSNWWDGISVCSIAILNDILYIQTTANNVCYIDLTDNTNCGVVKLPDNTTEVAGEESFFARQRCPFASFGKGIVFASTSLYSNIQKNYILDGATAYPLDLAAYRQYDSITTGFYMGKYNETAVLIGDTSYGAALCYLPALMTKNNLESAVTKTADMTMRVTYTVTDSE